MWSHFWKVSTQGLFVAMFWPLIPQFVCNCLFYWALYFNPIINIDLVVKEVRRLETQVLWLALPRLWRTLPASLTAELWWLNEAGEGTDFLFSSPSKQGAALSVKGYNQVLSPSARGIVAAGIDIPEQGRRRSSTSHLATLFTGTREAQSVTACKDPGSSKDTVRATSEGCPIRSPSCPNLWRTKAPRASESPETAQNQARRGLPYPLSKSSLGKWEKVFCHRYRQLHTKNTEVKAKSSWQFYLWKSC